MWYLFANLWPYVLAAFLIGCAFGWFTCERAEE